MEIVSISDHLHEMWEPVFWEKKKKNISTCHLLEILPSMLSINVSKYLG